jgi:periplasmic protein TonB
MVMKRSRLRLYVLLSLLIHILLLWLLRFLPPYHPTPPSPVAIRMLDVPPAPTPLPRATPRPPQEERRQPQERKPQRPQQGGVLVELPKPVKEERPDAARIVSQFDSKAQDVGPGESGVQKPSGEKPPQLPPELALPERYSTQRSTPPQTPPSQPKLQDPTPPAPSQQARQLPPPTPRNAEKPRQLQPQKGTVPVPAGEQPTPKSAPQPKEPRFRITAEQEVAMLQRPYPEAEQARQQAMEEHFARLEKNLPLPSFDAPGVYDKGAEQPGEGQQTTGGGKYRSIDAFGLQHFSYLVGVKRKIELVFSVPYFTPYNGTVGVPIVGFTIRRDGALAEAVLLRSSGYAVVDRALLDAVKRAAPYGPFPEHLPDGEISIRVYATLS